MLNPLGNGGLIENAIFPNPPVALTGATLAVSINLVSATVGVSNTVVKEGRSTTFKLNVAVLLKFQKSRTVILYVVVLRTAVAIPLTKPVLVLKIKFPGNAGSIR
jgi:hypothetical protein